MYEELCIIFYPDPRLKRISSDVVQFDEQLAQLAQRMLQLMRDSRGVGLAAPQVGINIRLFIMNHSGKTEDDRIYVNPALSEPQGEEIGEEGCLSLPKINADILRDKTLTLTARDLAGNPITQTETGYITRIWQHEIDHLNGTLITDRMGPTAKMEFRKILKDLEDQYAAAHPAPPSKKRRS